MKHKTKQNLFIPRLYSEIRETEKIFKHKTNRREFFNNLFSNKFAIVGMIILSIFVLSAIIIPLTTIDPYLIDSGNAHANPSKKHLFGTDWSGRDIWSRTWHGLRFSLLLSLIVSSINITIGTLIGIFQGYYTKFDKYSTLAMKVMYALPSVLILIIFSVVFDPSLLVMVLALCMTGWVMPSQQIRTQALSVRKSNYITASIVLGSNWRKLFKNIFISILPILVVQFSITVPQVILAEAFLGFLGLSIPDMPTMGNVINDGRPYILTNPLEITLPTSIMLFTVGGFQIIGFGIEDSFRRMI